MKKLNLIRKNKKNRIIFFKKELYNLYYKSIYYIIKNKNYKYYIYNKIRTNYTSKLKIRNMCIKTGVSYYVFRKYKLSRMFLKTYISLGKINGLKKASW